MAPAPASVSAAAGWNPQDTPMGITPAARAIAMSKLESPTMTVSWGAAPVSRMA